jgi:hypothetical protein
MHRFPRTTRARALDGTPPGALAGEIRRYRAERGLMRSPSELAGFWTRVADLDAEITRCHADGYAADVDRLLDERAQWQQERDELLGAVVRPRRSA